MDLKARLAKYMPKTEGEQGTKEALLAYLAGENIPANDRFIVLAPVLADGGKKLEAVFYSSLSHLDAEEDLAFAVAERAATEMKKAGIYPLGSEILLLGAEAVDDACYKYWIAYGLFREEQGRKSSSLRYAGAESGCIHPHLQTAHARIFAAAQNLLCEKRELYTALPAPLLAWYKESARVLPWRRDKEPYHVLVSEIMLQQTRVEAVKGFYMRFLEAFPSIEALAGASEQELYKRWEGLGYYARARNLQKAARLILEEYDGYFPEEYTQVLSLPGVGEYTAGAICSICFEQPTPAVDGNVLRVISRITEHFGRIGSVFWKREVQKELALIYPQGKCGDFTQSLMELGAMVCLPGKAPLCGQCPAADFCMARRNDTQQMLPVRGEKKKRRIEERTVFLLSVDGRIALKKRPEKGLLAGLWELPNLLGKLDAARALEAAQQWGAECSGAFHTVERTHVFTHVEWRMTCYYLTCQREAVGFVWADAAELKERYALPTAFRQFLS